MAEGSDHGQTKAKSTPTLQELSNVLAQVVDWHLLGVKLGVKAHELGAIERNYPGNVVRCKHEMLDHCLRNAKIPTWKAVADALILMGEHEAVLTIQTQYCSSSTATGTPNIQAPPCMADSSLLAKENLQMIRYKYASLLRLALCVLQGKNIDMSIFRVFLAALYLPEEDSRAVDSSRFISEVLGRAQSLSEIFQSLLLQGLMNYKNFYVLRSIINEYARGEMKEKLDEYEEALAGFDLVTKIQDYLNAELKESEQSKLDPKLLNELSVKVKANVTDRTMKYISELWDSLAYRIQVPVTALPFHKVAKGCVEITWLVPFHLTHFATRRLQESTNYFQEENILRVTIAGMCVYQELPPVEGSARMVETDLGKKLTSSEPKVVSLESIQYLMTEEEKLNMSITTAHQVAWRLHKLGDEIDAKVTEELSEAMADLLRQQSVFQISLKQFRGMCRRVLTKCSGQLHTGWEQMTVVYLGMGGLVRELRRQDSQLSSAREHQFQQFAGQVMEEVGLQRWVMQQGGIRMVMRAGEPLDLKDSSQPKVDISNVN